jgi:hypothetical protein
MEKLELKNVKFSEWNSEETNCFQAVVYFNGVKSAMVQNEGHGGSTDLYPIGDNFEAFRKVRAYCQSQADANREEYFETYTIIDLIFEDWLKDHYAKKDQLKLSKNFNKGICYATVDEEKEKYAILTFNKGKQKVTISEMQSNVYGRQHLIKSCEKLVADGYKILNTNLNFNI